MFGTTENHFSVNFNYERYVWVFDQYLVLLFIYNAMPCVIV